MQWLGNAVRRVAGNDDNGRTRRQVKNSFPTKIFGGTVNCCGERRPSDRGRSRHFRSGRKKSRNRKLVQGQNRCYSSIVSGCAHCVGPRYAASPLKTGATCRQQLRGRKERTVICAGDASPQVADSLLKPGLPAQKTHPTVQAFRAPIANHPLWGGSANVVSTLRPVPPVAQARRVRSRLVRPQLESLEVRTLPSATSWPETLTPFAEREPNDVLDQAQQLSL